MNTTIILTGVIVATTKEQTVTDKDMTTKERFELVNKNFNDIYEKIKEIQQPKTLSSQLPINQNQKLHWGVWLILGVCIFCLGFSTYASAVYMGILPGHTAQNTDNQVDRDKINPFFSSDGDIYFYDNKIQFANVVFDGVKNITFDINDTSYQTNKITYFSVESKSDMMFTNGFRFIRKKNTKYMIDEVDGKWIIKNKNGNLYLEQLYFYSKKSSLGIKTNISGNTNTDTTNNINIVEVECERFILEIDNNLNLAKIFPQN